MSHVPKVCAVGMPKPEQQNSIEHVFLGEFGASVSLGGLV